MVVDREDGSASAHQQPILNTACIFDVKKTDHSGFAPAVHSVLQAWDGFLLCHSASQEPTQ
jgi:hypothetical protein